MIEFPLAVGLRLPLPLIHSSSHFLRRWTADAVARLGGVPRLLVYDMHMVDLVRTSSVERLNIPASAALFYRLSWLGRGDDTFGELRRMIRHLRARGIDSCSSGTIIGNARRRRSAMADDLYHIRFSSEFVAAWRDLVSNVFRWRVDEGFCIVPRPGGFPRVATHVPLLSYSDLNLAGAQALLMRVPRTRFLVKVLPDASETGPPRSGEPVVMRLDIEGKNPDRVWREDLRSVCRNRARVSFRQNYKVVGAESDRTLRDGYRVFLAIMRRHGTPAWPFALLKELVRRDLGRVRVLYRKDRPVAMLVLVIDNRIAWVPWCGAELEEKNGCPNHLTHWRAIEDAVAARCSIFDFGRSAYEGTTYESRESGGPCPYRWHTLAAAPSPSTGAMKRRLASGGGFLRGSRTGWVPWYADIFPKCDWNENGPKGLLEGSVRTYGAERRHVKQKKLFCIGAKYRAPARHRAGTHRLSQGLRILDAGCGDGSVGAHLARTNTVAGIDFSPNMASLARKIGLFSLVADMEELPFAEESFDVVFSVEPVTLVENPQACLTSLARLVKPGGCMVVSVINSRSVLRCAVGGLYRFSGKILPTPLSIEAVRGEPPPRRMYDRTRIVRGAASRRFFPHLDSELPKVKELLANNIVMKAVKPK